MATIVYIDGFNLYFGALKNTTYKWLDLEALCRRVLPKDNIVSIKYFTARVSVRDGDQGPQRRQQVYLRALNTLPIVDIYYGRFQSHVVTMRLASQPHSGPRTVPVIKTEEKGSDVNLASHLLLDGFRQRYDTAVVVSNDSDLAEPIMMVKRDLRLKVGVVNPHHARRRARDFQATFFKQLRPSVLPQCQFPEKLVDANGDVIHKPVRW